MTQPLHSIQELLTLSESSVGKLLRKAQALEELNQLLRHILDVELYPHCQVGGYDAGILTLFTSNAALATRLRYSVPAMLSKLRVIPIWAGLCQIQIKIHSHWQPMTSQVPQNEPCPPLKISAANAKEILALVQLLKDKPGMEKLTASLMRIAEHGD